MNFEIVEPLPATRPYRQFPIGDISDESEEAQKLQDLQALHEAAPSDKARLCRRMAISGDYSAWIRGSVTRGDLGQLFEAWGNTLIPYDPSAAKRGLTLFRVGVGFVHSLLPPLQHKFDAELRVMSAYPAHVISWMSDSAWSTMHLSHPVVFNLLGPLCQFAAEAWGTHSLEEATLVDAAIVLPYLLSSTSSLMGCIPNTAQGA